MAKGNGGTRSGSSSNASGVGTITTQKYTRLTDVTNFEDYLEDVYQAARTVRKNFVANENPTKSDYQSAIAQLNEYKDVTEDAAVKIKKYKEEYDGTPEERRKAYSLVERAKRLDITSLEMTFDMIEKSINQVQKHYKSK